MCGCSTQSEELVSTPPCRNKGQERTEVLKRGLEPEEKQGGHETDQ